MKRDADPPPTLNEHFDRFYRLEMAIAGWLTMAFSVMTFAVLVHINLNYVVGVAMILVGVAFVLTTLVGAVAWGAFGEYKLAGIMRVRRVLMVIKFFLVIVIAGLAVWAAVVMIQRASA